MLLSIMVGAILVTYFAADITRRSEIESLTSEIETKSIEIETIKEMNINFTDHFLKSLGSLDLARENRAEGDLNFDLAARIWYPQSEYKKVIDNCTDAMGDYFISHQNFNLSRGCNGFKGFFFRSLRLLLNPILIIIY